MQVMWGPPCEEMCPLPPLRGRPPRTCVFLFFFLFFFFLTALDTGLEGPRA